MRYSLSLQQRISMAFLAMSLLILIASGAGLLFTTTVQGTFTATRQGIDQFERVSNLQVSWLTLVTSVDNMLQIKDLSSAELLLQNNLNTFNHQLKNIQIMPLGQRSEAITKNQRVVESLLLVGEELSDLINELLNAAREGDWTQAQKLRHTEMVILQQRLNEGMAQLNQNIQDDIAFSISESARIQKFTHSYWLLTAFTALAVGVSLAMLTTRTISRPIRQLIAQVQRVTERDFSPFPPLSQQDEIGDLSRSFNLMTDWLRESYETLEDRVASRTHELERRTLQVQVAAEVARDVTSAHSLDELLNRATHLIQSHFGYYHASLFLLDEANEFAVLRAATGEAGREMLSRGHRLRVGDDCMVGFVTESGRSRTVPDVSIEANHVIDPLLPETRSAIALPLKVGDRVIGALDVQSDSGSGFQEEDLTILQILADQLAVAIENSRLMNQDHENMRELEFLYSQYSREAWEKTMRARTVTGYQFDQSGITPIPAAQAQEGEMQADLRTRPLSIPLESRGEVIGALEVWPEQGEFSSDEAAFLEAIGKRVSQAMETARLYQETQSRAERERLARQIVDKFHATNDPRLIMQTAVQELRQALHASRAQILLRPAQPEPEETSPSQAQAKEFNLNVKEKSA